MFEAENFRFQTYLRPGRCTQPSFLIPHTMADNLIEAVAAASGNTNRPCQTGMRPSLTRARRGLSHAACCTCKGAHACTQHSRGSADTLRVIPDGCHSSLCARASAGLRSASPPSQLDGKRFAEAERQPAPPRSAKIPSPLVAESCNTERHRRGSKAVKPTSEALSVARKPQASVF